MAESPYTVCSWGFSLQIADPFCKLHAFRKSVTTYTHPTQGTWNTDKPFFFLPLFFFLTPALDVLLAAGDTGSAEARSQEPCSDADTRDRSRVCSHMGTKTA